MNKPQIEMMPLASLTAYDKNSRTHSPEQVKQIAASLREFGFTNPVLIDSSGGIIAGHGRALAAESIGMEIVPCLRLAHLTEAQKKAYIIADNKLAENAGWNMDMLRLEVLELQELDFNLDLLGFDGKELDGMLEFLEPNDGLTDEDEVPELPEEPTTKPGDVWIMGKHRLMCGNSTSLDSIGVLLSGTKPELLFTDPPYGIAIVKKNRVGGGGPTKFGKVGGKKMVQATNYVAFENDDTTDVARGAYAAAVAAGVKNMIIWGGNYFTDFLPPSMCWVVWDKENTGNFADVELAWTSFNKGAKRYKWLWNGLSRKGDRKTEGLKRVHPTQKPVGMIVDVMADFPAATILDLFLGSGSTLIAAEKTKRVCYGMELHPHYCDVIVKRWEQFTGKTAVLEAR
jgi:DNA modification methylase